MTRDDAPDADSGERRASYKPDDDAEAHYWEPGEQRAEDVPDDVAERAMSDELQRQTTERMKRDVTGNRRDEEGPAARGTSRDDA